MKNSKQREPKITKMNPDIKAVKKRALLVLTVFTVLLLFMMYRVGFIQFIKGDEYRNMAYDIQTVKKQIVPKRGSIYDRHGSKLSILLYLANSLEVIKDDFLDENKKKIE